MNKHTEVEEIRELIKIVADTGVQRQKWAEEEAVRLLTQAEQRGYTQGRIDEAKTCEGCKKSREDITN